MKGNEKLIHRIWSKHYKRMLYSEAFHNNYYTKHKFGKVVCGIKAETISRTFRSKPMLFIGLNDKDLKPIYVGDIVSNVDESGMLFVVKYYSSSDTATFGLETTDGELFWFEHYPANCLKVIGDVFQNPELARKFVNVFKLNGDDIHG